MARLRVVARLPLIRWRFCIELSSWLLDFRSIIATFQTCHLWCSDMQLWSPASKSLALSLPSRLYASSQLSTIQTPFLRGCKCKVVRRHHEDRIGDHIARRQEPWPKTVRRSARFSPVQNTYHPLHQLVVGPSAAFREQSRSCSIQHSARLGSRNSDLVGAEYLYTCRDGGCNAVQ